MLLQEYKDKHALAAPEFTRANGSFADAYSGSYLTPFSSYTVTVAQKKIAFTNTTGRAIYDNPLIKEIKKDTPFDISFKAIMPGDGYLVGNAKKDGSTPGIAFYVERGMLTGVIASEDGIIAKAEVEVNPMPTTEIEYRFKFDGETLAIERGLFKKTVAVSLGDEPIEPTGMFTISAEPDTTVSSKITIREFMITDGTPFIEDRFAIKAVDGKHYAFSGNAWQEVEPEHMSLGKGMTKEQLEALTDTQMANAPGDILVRWSDIDRTNSFAVQALAENIMIGDVLSEEFSIELDNAEEAIVTKQASILDEFEEDDVYIGYWSADGTNNELVTVTGIRNKSYVQLSKPREIINRASYFKATDNSTGYTKRARYVFSSSEDPTRYTFEDGAFIEYDWTPDNIELHAMRNADLKNATFNNWPYDDVILGIYVDDDEYGQTKTKITKVEFVDTIPVNTSVVSQSTVYVLNTTAAIDVRATGRHITATISDEDKTDLQYRIELNGHPYYPSDGSFTGFATPDVNLDLMIDSTKINVGLNNIVTVIFKDVFGTISTASVSFLGEYNGLLFLDEGGNYLTTDNKQVVNYLDFGDVIAGQTTPERIVTLKNTYGYDVHNIKVIVENKYDTFDVQLSEAGMEFVPVDAIDVGTLKDGESIDFLVRMKTELFVAPEVQDVFIIKAIGEKE